jgi:acyl dehydratase
LTPATFSDLDDLLAAPPADLGTTDWIELSHPEVSSFEQATHGPVSPYLALSLTNRFLPDLLQVPAASSGVNYGAESVHFGETLSVGDRVRAAASLVAAGEVAGGVQTTVEIRIEVDGGDGPACVVRSLSRWLR